RLQVESRDAVCPHQSIQVAHQTLTLTGSQSDGLKAIQDASWRQVDVGSFPQHGILIPMASHYADSGHSADRRPYSVRSNRRSPFNVSSRIAATCPSGSRDFRRYSSFHFPPFSSVSASARMSVSFNVPTQPTQATCRCLL